MIPLHFVAVLWSACVPSSANQWFGDSCVDPKTYRSPSGAFELFVDPSEPVGHGSARYRMTRSGSEVWAKELDCTLLEAAVSDEGVVAGYAYARRSESVADAGPTDLLCTLIVDPHGALRLNASVKRSGSDYLHELPNPLVAGTLFDPDNDRWIVRVNDPDVNEMNEEWWIHELSTGKQVAKIHPKESLPEREVARWVIEALPVRGTDLVLCQWWRVESFEASGDWIVGALFTLIDPSGAVVWKLDLPRDYEQQDEDQEDRLRAEIRRTGAILSCDRERTFEVAQVAEAKRVTFTVTRDTQATAGWRVSEVSRSDHAFDLEEKDAPPEPGVAASALALEYLGAIELAGTGTELWKVSSFDIDDQGRIGIVQVNSRQRSRFQWFESTGRLLAGFDLMVPNRLEETGWMETAWLGGSRWLLYRSGYGEAARTEAWWLDLPAGGLEPVSALDCPPIEAVDGTGDGGFVALTSESAEYTMIEQLVLVDPQGNLRELGYVAYGNSESGLFSPADVCLAKPGEIGALDTIRHEIQRFDLDGKPTGAIELDSTLGRELSYPTDLCADPRGNWIVHDFSGDPSVVKVSPEGQSISAFDPRYPDGLALEPVIDLHADPEGSLWISDHHSVVRLNESGIVEQVLGDAPDAFQLLEPDNCSVDSFGRILIGDDRTGAVHVFDRSGKRTMVCVPPLEHVEQGIDIETIAVSGDGAIHVGLGDYGHPREYLAYGPSGTFLGIEELEGEILFQSGRPSRWRLSGNVITLEGPDGNRLREIRRTPGNRWLRGTHPASAAPDGSLALISDGLHIFSASGEPLLSAPIGRIFVSELAFTGARAFYLDDSVLRAVGMAGNLQASVLLGSEFPEGAQGVPRWNAASEELWIVLPTERRVLRYRVGD